MTTDERLDKIDKRLEDIEDMVDTIYAIIVSLNEKVIENL